MVRLYQTTLGDLPPVKPLTLGLWTTAASAAQTLLDARAGEALVLDHGRPLGVVSSRGLVALLARCGDQASHQVVRDIMDPVAVAPEEAYLPPTLRHMLATPSRRLAVVDAKGLAMGILAPYHVVRAFGDMEELAGSTVAQVMARTVVTARETEAVPLVLGRMSRSGVGGVVVIDEEDRPLGVFTSRDVMAHLAADQALQTARVADCMRAPVVAVSPHLPLSAALAGMDGNGGGRLAVTDAAGLLQGVLTWTDVAAAISRILTEAEDGRTRELATRYRDLYDHAPQGLFRLDVAGYPLAANATLARLMGFDDPATFVRQARRTAHPLRLDLPERRKLLIQTLSSLDPVRFEAKLFHPDGSATRLDCVLRAVRDAQGAPLHLEGMVGAEGADTTVPATSEAGYRSIVEHQTELICRLTPDRRLFMVNEAFARYWGTTPEACVASGFHPDILEEDRQRMAARLDALSPQRPTTGFEFRVIRPDGRQRWQRWTCRAIFDAAGTLVEYQAVGRDVTGRKRVEEHLRAQNLFAQTLIETMPAPVFFRNTQSRYQGCNKAFESLVGLPRERFLGQHIHMFCEVCAAKDQELIRRGGRQVYETTLKSSLGTRDVLVRSSLFHDVDGKAAGIIGIVLDITDRKRAEAAASKVRDDLEAGLARHADELREANQRLTAEVAERQRAEVQLRRNTLFLETVLNAIQDGICVLTPDLTILKVNQAMCNMYSEHGIQDGRKCYDFYHNFEAPCEHCPSLRALATGKLAIGVVPKDEAGGAPGWVELYSYPLFGEDGTITGVVEIVRDVTERKKLEAELAAALERAEAGSQAKGAFLANMSHEIRTPLNAVLGYVQLMLHDQLEPHQRERLLVVEESATTLLGIINDILDYSKIEAGRLEIRDERFDLARCLESAIKEQEILARNKGLSLRLVREPQLPRCVRGDGLRLRQILRNLVGNAVKYTDKGGITVTVGVEGPALPDRAGNERVMLRFAVADTGMGIPEAEQARIFESFTQVNLGLTRSQGGTGLGLAICRRLAGLMDGVVSMQSQGGQGSVFWLRCPFVVEQADTPPPLAASEGTVAGDLGPLRILLVEDNRINSLFASDLLGSRGHEVVTAENGQAALDYLAGHNVDVVLMDIQMPVMDGLSATRVIRAGSRGIDPNLPVVGLSAYALDQERERFLSAGLDGYITKPFCEETCFATIKRVLSRRGRPRVLGQETAAPSPEPPAVCLDTESLATRYRDKPTLLVRVGREFLSSVPNQLESLKKALAEGDMVVCERVGHTLKGNAAMFGAEAMRALAARIEAVAASGDRHVLAGLVVELTEACRAVMHNMQLFLTKLGG